MKRMALGLACLGLWLGMAGKSEATISLGYINSSGSTLNYLPAYGINVTYLNNPIGLTAASLAGFDAVMVASNGGFSDPTGIGNAVADFADTGKGVVLTEFEFYGFSGLQVAGRLATVGYTPFTPDSSGTNYVVPDILGTIYQPSSPILNGVNKANVTTGYQHIVGLAAGAHLVADWATTGRHAIAYNNLAHSSIVGLNLFPPDGYGSSTPDSQRMIANAIIFSTVSPSAAVPEPSTFVAATLAGTVALGSMLRRRKLARS